MYACVCVCMSCMLSNCKPKVSMCNNIMHKVEKKTQPVNLTKWWRYRVLQSIVFIITSLVGYACHFTFSKIVSFFARLALNNLRLLNHSIYSTNWNVDNLVWSNNVVYSCAFVSILWEGWKLITQLTHVSIVGNSMHFHASLIS